MRKIGSGLIVFAALGFLAVVSAVRADEQKIDLDQVPKAVMDAVKAKFPDAKLTGASKETEDGKTTYEVAFTYKDHKYEVECTAEGTFVAIDKQIEAKDLPKAVAKTLEEKYPKATYKVIEEVTKDDKIAEYEVELTTADKKSVEVVLDPAGKVLKEEKKEEKKPSTLQPGQPADAAVIPSTDEGSPRRRGILGNLLSRIRERRNR